ncbi:MAG: hypothetical protein H8E28_05375 [Anaerolineae bacterium]|nr:hypothetical protein [Anaerolineae bacterium]MBL6965264.1 hypothetical protein [Anaerolineales bacterium]
MYKKVLIFVLVIVMVALAGCSAKEKGGPTTADAPPDAVPDLVGVYVVNGVDPLGTEYGGHLTIRAGEKELEYLLQWIIVGSIQEGTGVLEGNQLFVEWRAIEGVTGKTQGTAMYTVTLGRELYGTRTVEGHSGVGEEIAFPND